MTEIIWNIAAAIGALMLLPFAVVIVGGLIGLAVVGFTLAIVTVAEWHEKRTRREGGGNG